MGEIKKKAQTQYNKQVIQGLKLQQKMLTAVDMVSIKYQQSTKALDIQTQQSQTLLSINDNMAVGIAASMQARLQVVDSIKMQLDQQKKLTSDLQKANKIVPSPHAQNLINQSKQKQLQLTSKMLQKTKALRDGWIGAVNASTTGKGRIAKIMVTESQNLTQVISKFGGVVSSVTGSTSTLAGSKRSQSFNKQGGITGPGFGQGQATYQTDVDKRLGINTPQLSKDLALGLRDAMIPVVQALKDNAPVIVPFNSNNPSQTVDPAVRSRQGRGGFTPPVPGSGSTAPAQAPNAVPTGPTSSTKVSTDSNGWKTVQINLTVKNYDEAIQQLRKALQPGTPRGTR